MGIRLFAHWSSHMLVVAILSLALGMQTGAMSFATQAHAATQTQLTTESMPTASVTMNHDGHHGHDAHDAASSQPSHCPDSGTLPHCGKLGCGGMHCDNTAVILTSSTSILRVTPSLGTLPLVLATRFSAEPPIQPPRS